MYSLRTKLTAAFAITAVLCVAMISLFSNWQLKYHFQEYVQQNQIKKNVDLVALVEDSWKTKGSFEIKELESIGVYGLKQGMMIQIIENEKILWTAETYENFEAINTPISLFQEGNLQYVNFPILVNGKEIGSVKIANNGKLNYNQLDLHFIQTLNQVFIAVGLFSSVLAIGFGALWSKRISQPITNVIRSAAFIANGTYNERLHENSSTKEIKALTEAINQLAATLEVQEDLRKRLTGDVAHELRTPLTTIQSHVEAMVDGIWEPTKERLASCHEEIVRITGLVSDLEKLAHYESEALLLNKTHFEGEALVQQVLQTFEATLAQKQLQVEVLFDASELYGDRDKLKQVLINLVSNAVKFTGDGGHLTLKLGTAKENGEEREHLIEVIDTGTGIAPGDLPFIFERFYRADVSRNRLTGGSGIGLSLVKIIVEAHHGHISVTSEVGKGTHFKIILPKG